ncbi:MAG: hypothetical protein D5R98_03970 [Desulfonatronovibrio sp. MSAO_Bac4]|nr:MAG: hypothetical protein D5R98_03970 [Desulfonatronovibrio sp. MSAO_Bac4]
MSRPGFYFCFCPDPNLIKMQVNKVLEGTGQKNWTKQTIWIDDPAQHTKIWDALNLPPMAGPPRAVLLRKCESAQAQFWKDISPCLRGFKSGIWPFFCFESAWDKGKPKIPATVSKRKFFRFAREKSWIWEFPGLTRENISRYINQKLAELETHADSDVKSALSLMLPLSSQAVDMELEKLSLLSLPEREITQEHLQVVPSHLDMDIFSFLMQIQNGTDLTPAWRKIFNEQLKGEGLLFPFMGLLLREARILWLLATGQEQGVHLYPRQKQSKKALAQKIGVTKISALWEMIIDAETGVKSGRINPEQAMELLTAGLFEIFSPQNA